jgi:geranylgeranyl transferase type-2 subunit beta
VLAILDRLDWIDQSKLISFILHCQNEEQGGIADRPGDEADVFHTFFGICGLSFLGYSEKLKNMETNTETKELDELVEFMNVNPTFALPVDCVERLGLQCQTYFQQSKKN